MIIRHVKAIGFAAIFALFASNAAHATEAKQKTANGETLSQYITLIAVNTQLVVAGIITFPVVRKRRLRNRFELDQEPNFAPADSPNQLPSSSSQEQLQPSPSQEAPLPSGWAESVDPDTGVPVWVNESTGERRFVRPTSDSTPPPLPPRSSIDTEPDANQLAVIDYFSFDRDGFKTSQTGASAGGLDGKLAVWINGGYSTFDEDQAAIDSDGDTWTVAVGGDWQFTERFVAGVSVSGSVSEANTTFNDGDVETTGFSVSPYFVSILGADGNLLLDGMVGFTMNDNDATRSSGAITSSYDSSNWFAGANLTYLYRRGNFTILPTAGIFWLDSTTDGYTESGGVVVDESGSKFGQLKAGARIEYTKNEAFTPYVSVTGEYDFETEDFSSFTGANRPSVEDKGATLGAGFSVQLTEKLGGTIAGTTALGRDNYQAYSLSGTLRFQF